MSSHPPGAIYRPPRINGYVIILVIHKALLALGVLLHDLLKVVHLVQLLFLMKLVASTCLLFIQKPFSTGKRLTKKQWVHILRHAIVACVINMLWLFGLTQCGSLRTVLLTEHKDVLVIAGASAIFAGTGRHSKFRGAVCFLVGVASLLLLDHDDAELTPTEHPEGFLHHGISHVFYYAVSWLGLADHKAGVLLLFIVLCLHVLFNAASRRLAVDVGGAKRLNALSSLASVILLFPWAVILQFMHWSTSWVGLLVPIIFVGLLVFVLDYYIEAVCSARLDAPRAAQVGSLVTFGVALLVSWAWSGHLPSHQFIASQSEHALSGGVLFSFVAFSAATVVLGSPSFKGSKCTFVGYSAAGLPLYSFSGENVQGPPHASLIVAIKHGLKQILEEPDSRKIFYFLCLNVVFTFVELLYGIWTNSLGLISDGFHMMFDCSALVMGLCAAILARKKATKTFPFGYGRIQVLSGFINSLFLVVVAFMVFVEASDDSRKVFTFVELLYGIWTNSLGLISDGFHMMFDCSALVMGLCAAILARKKATKTFPFGYGRIQVLSGFINSLFLVVVAFMVFVEAIGRLFDPPQVLTERLLTISVAGLFVKLLGIWAFRNSHFHGHSHGHGHSHDANMQGVFLHIVADTLGSVGVIVSSLLLEHFGLLVADPVCSLFIAALIFLSVLPLLKHSSLSLLLRTPVGMEKPIAAALAKVLGVEGVLSYREQHFWTHTPEVVAGSIHVQVRPDVSEQKVISQVTAIFKDLGFAYFTVQVEKDEFFHHMSGISSTCRHQLTTRSSLTTGDALHMIKAI